MMPETPELSARIDPTWMHVILRVDAIRTDTLRAIAEAWAEDPGLMAGVFDKLAEAATAGPVGVWEAAALDAEADLRMDMPQTELGEIDAVRLADELSTAAQATMSARRRAAQVVELPAPRDRSAA